MKRQFTIGTRGAFAAPALVFLGACAAFHAQSPAAASSGVAGSSAFSASSDFAPAAKTADVAKTEIVSFEDGGFPADVRLLMKKTTRVQVTAERAKYGAQSLRWDWQPGEAITFRHDIGFKPHTDGAIDNKLGTFSVWIYNTAARPGEHLRFEFGRGRERDCWFDFGLDFTGWRTCWVAYERDMQGAPRTDMDTLRIIAPAADSAAGDSAAVVAADAGAAPAPATNAPAAGTLFIDSLVFCHLIDARDQTRDGQVPFVNTVIAKQANAHWSALLAFDRQPLPDIPLPADALQAARIADTRYASLLPTPARLTDGKIAQLAERFSAWQIRRLPGGGTSGRPVCYPYEKDAYPASSPEARESTSPHSAIASFNQLSLELALAHRAPNATPAGRARLRDMFLACFDHMRDQGWQHGSVQGTVHHLGYTMRNYYVARYLMRDVLRETGRLAHAWRDMAWFSGAGRACTPPDKINGESIDTLNTILPGQIAACLMIDDEPLRARWLAATTRWLGRVLEPSAGLNGGIAPDGCIVHHCNHYPAYAVGGIDGATEALWIFGNTSLRVPEAGHASLRRAMFNLRFHCNVLHWPLSLSGRHPTGRFTLNPRPYLFLALAGTPDGRASTDAGALAVWKRLDNAAAPQAKTKPPALVDKKIPAAATPETPPAGHLTLSYATTSAHRRDGWLVTARGYNRYLWGSEIYPGANMYGRYLAYGHLEILARGDPVNSFDSGYAQEGWDWNCWPGVTAIHLPIPELRDRVANVDIHSGYEEMLLSDETFAGGSNLENRNGVFAMKLHEHAKYDGSHRARKSVFFFDDRVIALGSGITNTDAAHGTRTTLFQNHLADPARDAPTPPSRDNACARLRDAVGNTYFVLGESAADLRVQNSRQRSRSQDDKTDTEGDFALAWLDHGAAPKAAGYAYAILVQPTAEREKTFASELAAPATAATVVTPTTAAASATTVTAATPAIASAPATTVTAATPAIASTPVTTATIATPITAAALTTTATTDTPAITSTPATAAAAPFIIHRRDDTAHIVRDRDTGILAAACFEPVSDTGLEIAAVSRPSIVMLRAGKNDPAVISVCDPDLQLYEGVEVDQYNPDGTLREVSIYSRKWVNSPGTPSTVLVTLDGAYTPARPDPRIRTLPSPRENQTLLEFTCRDGQPVETILQRVSK